MKEGAHVATGWATRARISAGAALLLFQLAGIVYARGVDTRYFAWAPYDRISIFELKARRGSEELGPEEIAARYRLPNSKRDNRAIEHVIAVVRQVETSKDVAERVEAELRYRVNGGPERTWRYPDQ